MKFFNRSTKMYKVKSKDIKGIQFFCLFFFFSFIHNLPWKWNFETKEGWLKCLNHNPWIHPSRFRSSYTSTHSHQGLWLWLIHFTDVQADLGIPCLNMPQGPISLGAASYISDRFPTRVHMHLAKTQISLYISAVWSEFSLLAKRHFGYLATHWVHSKDSDQTARPTM